jgi:hypothetical protein
VTHAGALLHKLLCRNIYLPPKPVIELKIFNLHGNAWLHAKARNSIQVALQGSQALESFQTPYFGQHEPLVRGALQAAEAHEHGAAERQQHATYTGDTLHCAATYTHGSAANKEAYCRYADIT